MFTSGAFAMLQEQHDARQFDASGAMGRCLRYHTSDMHKKWDVNVAQYDQLPNDFCFRDSTPLLRFESLPWQTTQTSTWIRIAAITVFFDG